MFDFPNSEEPIEQVACFWLSNSMFLNLVHAIRDGGAVRGVVEDETVDDEPNDDDVEEVPSPRAAESEPRRRRRSDERSRSRSVSSNEGENQGDESGRKHSDALTSTHRSSANSSVADRPGGNKKDVDKVDDEDEEEEEEDVSAESDDSGSDADSASSP
jgi:hypothetical protein